MFAPQNATGNEAPPLLSMSAIMIPDLDIWRATLLMVKRYGADAAVQAGMYADELLVKK